MVYQWGTMTDKANAVREPDFTKYTKDHWSCLLYIETVVVDHGGIPDHRRMNDADRDAAEVMEADGLIVWGGTGINPVFSLTDAGWSVVGALRRWRAESGDKDLRAKVARDAFCHTATIAEVREALDMPEMFGGEPNYSDADVVRELLRHARARKGGE